MKWHAAPVVSGALLAVALGVVGVSGAAEEKPVRGVFLDTAQVNLINIEVFAADPTGKPVFGLLPEDFKIFEDGKPVTISNFFATGAPSPVEPSAAKVAQEPAGVSPGEGGPPLEQRLSLVFFVDNTGITPAQRNIALQHARALLDSAIRLPRVEVMIVAHGPDTRIRQSFTADAAALAKALNVISQEPTDTVGYSSDHTLFDRVLSLSAEPEHFSARQNALARESDATDARGTLEMVRALAQEASERTRAAVASIQQFVTSLAGLPGRKAICYIGNGIQLRPGQAMLQAWESRFGRLGATSGVTAAMEGNDLSVVPQFRALVSHANADRVTFYSLDASGGAPPLSQSPEDVSPDPDPGAGQGESMNRGYSLQYLAYATGGTTVASTPAASPALALITKDFEAFYSLAYVAPHIGDGRNHLITVKTSRGGVQLRYRRNYLDKTADDRMIERNLGALLYDSGSNALEVGVMVKKEVRQKRGVYLVPLLVTVPLGKLALLPQGEAQEGKVSIWVAAKDADDRISPPFKNSFSVRIPTKDLTAALAKKVGYSFGVLLRPGAEKLAISLRDDVTQAESTVTARFTVGKGGKGPPEVVTGLQM